MKDSIFKNYKPKSVEIDGNKKLKGYQLTTLAFVYSNQKLEVF
ncbi:MAG: hypothetical protein PHT36_00830 [Patescibacteria group bacterium]|nr:hypothetical protein [Patescibacteria group bacterium]